MSGYEDTTARARELVEGADRIAVLTGAGISAESGVPTFRGGGKSLVWRGMPFEQLSSAAMVRNDLPLVWEWFDYRRKAVGKCVPNAGHLALAAAQISGNFHQFQLITQNIDGLHAAAGSSGVIELHGNIWRTRCTVCERLDDLTEGERPPKCPACGAPMRPHVVLFGEFLDAENVERAREAAASADVCLVVGTSGLVYPANELPHLTRASGGKVIEINPEETVLTNRADISIRAKSAAVLPLLFGQPNAE